MHRNLRPSTPLRHLAILRQAQRHAHRPVIAARGFTFILHDPQLRAYANDHSDRIVKRDEAPSKEELDHETFGRLVPWSQCLESSSNVSVWIRGQDERHIEVQSALLQQVLIDEQKADIRVKWPEPYTYSVPILDLSQHETSAGLIFLFWLFNRRLPELKLDCDIKLASTPDNTTISNQDDYAHTNPAKLQPANSEREKKEMFNVGLTHAWMLGAAIRAPKFQNDCIRELAKLLQREEQDARRSSDPNYSSAIAWARRAYDASTAPPQTSANTFGARPTLDIGEIDDDNVGAPHEAFTSKTAAKDILPRGPPSHNDSEDISQPLREFAVDIAAKRVCDCSYDGITLTLAERRDLSTNAGFAAEVFGALGGHIGTGGVAIVDFVRAYFVKERAG